MNTLKRLDAETSDIFFNLQKTNYDGLRLDLSQNCQDQIEEEIRKDAEYAVSAFPRTFDGYSADDLTADFMRRL